MIFGTSEFNSSLFGVFDDTLVVSTKILTRADCPVGFICGAIGTQTCQSKATVRKGLVPAVTVCEAFLHNISLSRV